MTLARVTLLLLAPLLFGSTAIPAAELQHYPNATLIAATVNDGDSFMVE